MCHDNINEHVSYTRPEAAQFLLPANYSIIMLVCANVTVFLISSPMSEQIDVGLTRTLYTVRMVLADFAVFD